MKLLELVEPIEVSQGGVEHILKGEPSRLKQQHVQLGNPQVKGAGEVNDLTKANQVAVNACVYFIVVVVEISHRRGRSRVTTVVIVVTVVAKIAVDNQQRFQFPEEGGRFDAVAGLEVVEDNPCHVRLGIEQGRQGRQHSVALVGLGLLEGGVNGASRMHQFILDGSAFF